MDSDDSQSDGVERKKRKRNSVSCSLAVQPARSPPAAAWSTHARREEQQHVTCAVRAPLDAFESRYVSFFGFTKIPSLS